MQIPDYYIECTDNVVFTQGLPDECIDLIITSPPCNQGKEYEEKLSLVEYLDLMSPIVSETARILKRGGSLCWQVGNYVNNGEIFPLDIYFYAMIKETGLSLRNRIIWHYSHGACNHKSRFSNRYETILWFTKGDKYTFNLDPVRIPQKQPGKKYYKGPNKGKVSSNPLGKNPEDVWDIVYEKVADDWDKLVWNISNIKAHHPEKTEHPCPFPISLVERLVLALSNEGDIVMDPFMGSGSVLIGALKNGRQAVGVDKEQKYVKITEDRIHMLKQDKLRFMSLI